MTDYECGHKTDGVILIDSSILSIAAYLTWAYENGGLFDGCKRCWECWNKQHDKEIERYNKREVECDK